MTKLAGLFGSDEPPAPPRVEDIGIAPSATATSGTLPETETPPQPPKKKRGFWSRIFGVGKDDPPDDDQAPPLPPEKKSGG
jgi:hypothetical protein